MKQIALLLSVMISVTAFAQSDRYTGAMQKNLAMFDSAKTTEAYQSLAANFERIGEAEKSQWLPYYYASLALVTAGWMDQRLDKDVNAEKIKGLLDKAESLSKDNVDKSEVYSIRNMVATQQMLVDPQNRFMSYGQESANHLKKAQELNPKNPRVAYLEGVGVFNTPEQFGGGKQKAKPVLEKAMSLYNEEKTKPLYPNWGKQQAADILAQCE